MIKTIDKSINNALLWATSTKQAFYALTALILIAVVMSPPHSMQAWLLVIVSEFYQGVALPGLGSAQKKEAEETRKLLQETHDAVIDELKMIKEEMVIIKQEREDMRILVEIVKVRNNMMFTKDDLETFLSWYGVVSGEYHGSEEEDKLAEKMERLIRIFSE